MTITWKRVKAGRYEAETRLGTFTIDKDPCSLRMSEKWNMWSPHHQHIGYRTTLRQAKRVIENMLAVAERPGKFPTAAPKASTKITGGITTLEDTHDDNTDRWWYDVDMRQVKDENGLVVIDLFDRTDLSNDDGETIAAAPHALSLVARLAKSLAWFAGHDDAACRLVTEAHALLKDPGSSACITDDNASTFTGRK